MLKSTDEYTVNVNASRGMKEFQYDQVFMEDSTQEQIFEDTNVSIQHTCTDFIGKAMVLVIVSVCIRE